jgi:hypothetical protein
MEISWVEKLSADLSSVESSWSCWALDVEWEIMQGNLSKWEHRYPSVDKEGALTVSLQIGVVKKDASQLLQLSWGRPWVLQVDLSEWNASAEWIVAKVSSKPKNHEGKSSCDSFAEANCWLVSGSHGSDFILPWAMFWSIETQNQNNLKRSIVNRNAAPIQV